MTPQEMPTIEKTNFSRKVRRMLGLSLDAWNNVMLGSLGTAAVSAAIVVVSTYATIQLAKKEAADNAAAFEKYKVDAGVEISKANERAAEAQLALEKLKAPRTLSREQQAVISEAMKPFAGQRYEGQVASGVPDAFQLWSSIDASLQAAGWVRVPKPSAYTIGEPRKPRRLSA